MESHHRILAVLRSISRATQGQSRLLARSTGLGLVEAGILQTLTENGSMTMSGLARELQVSNATLTALADRLELKGYLARSRSSSDRRQVLASITEHGREAFALNLSGQQQRFVQRFSSLSTERQEQLLEAVRELADMMGALPPEPPPGLSS